MEWANTIKVATKVDHKKLEQLFIDTYALDMVKGLLTHNPFI